MYYSFVKPQNFYLRLAPWAPGLLGLSWFQRQKLGIRDPSVPRLSRRLVTIGWTPPPVTVDEKAEGKEATVRPLQDSQVYENRWSARPQGAGHTLGRGCAGEGTGGRLSAL